MTCPQVRQAKKPMVQRGFRTPWR